MEIQTAYPMKHSTKYLPYFALLHRFQLAIKIIFGGFLVALSTSIYANVNSVTSSPSVVNISAKNSANFNVNWLVNRTYIDPSGISGVPVTVTVSSPTAILQINGTTIATLAGNISRLSTLQDGETGTVSINEPFTLSPAISRRIAGSPAGSVRIIRTFTDTQTALAGTIRLFTSSISSGALTIRRNDLAFESNSRTDVIYQHDTIRAVANIHFNSSGILKGEWRIIDPTASSGQNSGRVLSVIRQNLVSSGEGRTKIISPPLPTNILGLYLVSFFVQNTNANLEAPILRYFVLNEPSHSPANTPIEINLISPKTDTNLNSDTLFVWQKINNVQAYQVELFDKNGNIPLTGKLVSAANSQLSLSSLSFEWLEPNHEYIWRIRAFGTDGKLVGQSQFQPIYTPE